MVLFFAVWLFPPFAYVIIKAVYNKTENRKFLRLRVSLPSEAVFETGYSICPYCKNEPEKGAVFCSKCGSELVPLPPKKMSKYWWPWFGVLGLGIVFSFILSFSLHDSKTGDDIGLTIFAISFLMLIVSFFVYAVRRWRWMRKNWFVIIPILLAIGKCSEGNVSRSKTEEEAKEQIRKLDTMNSIIMREQVEQYRKAAEQGDVMAMKELGDCYSEGIGVSQNYAEAVKWYRLAADQGNENAKEALHHLENDQYLQLQRFGAAAVRNDAAREAAEYEAAKRYYQTLLNLKLFDENDPDHIALRNFVEGK